MSLHAFADSKIMVGLFLASFQFSIFKEKEETKHLLKEF